jgi:hypothetical protein
MRHARSLPVLTLLPLALMLAACGGAKKDEGAGTAAGEILPGSVSDAMLPLDTVRSQAPLAPKVESTGAADATEADAAASDAAPAAEAPAAEAPAAAPTE